MYYIRKSSQIWAVHNPKTKKSRTLDSVEIELLLQEFPNLKLSYNTQSLCYFRNKINSISDLP